jgi:hypothetical protein
MFEDQISLEVVGARFSLFWLKNDESESRATGVNLFDGRGV